MCKSAEARQRSVFGQLEKASHGTFLYILLLWIQLFQGDLDPFPFLEDL